MARMWRDYMTHWRDARVAVEAYRALDSERILVLLDFVGKGRASGVEVARARARGANLFQIDNRRVTRLVLYFDRERALAVHEDSSALSEPSVCRSSRRL